MDSGDWQRVRSPPAVCCVEVGANIINARRVPDHISGGVAYAPKLPGALRFWRGIQHIAAGFLPASRSGSVRWSGIFRQVEGEAQYADSAATISQPNTRA